MPYTRAYEEHEVGSDLRRIYSEVRCAFDLPYVPTIFKLLAACPEYARMVWKDLGPVASSREFQTAAAALEEFIRSECIAGGWRFSDQERVLATQKILTADVPVLAGTVGVFARAMPRILLFARLLQKGYSGGQRGRVSSGKQSPALSRLISLHVPNETEAGLRAWLMFGEIKRATNAPIVMSVFRVLTPFPGYLASVWHDAKQVLNKPDFLRARDEVARRSVAISTGLPVRDHRETGKGISAEDWRSIEQTVDTYARLLPQFALMSVVWRRSFAVPGAIKTRAAS